MAQTQPTLRADTTGRIPELDGLRGVAILLVLLFHGGELADYGMHPLARVLAAGWSGVDLFFVLSGFLIGGILLDARNSPRYFQAFYLRRAFRILPVYYTWILLYVVIVAAAIWLKGSPQSVSDLRQVPIHVLFLQNMMFGASHFAAIWFVVTWSLAVEEQFYLVAPPMIRFLSRSRIVVLLVATVCVAPVLRFLLFRYFPSRTETIPFLMPCRADSLAFGILAAIAWRTDALREWLAKHPAVLKRTFYVSFAGVVVLLRWLVHPPGLVRATIGLSWLAVFFTCVLLAAISRTPGWLAGVLRLRTLRFLGAISYCVYIIHVAVNQLAHQLLLGTAEPRTDNPRGLAVTILALVATLCIAGISWKFFEKPLIKRGHNYSYWDEPVIDKVPQPVGVSR